MAYRRYRQGDGLTQYDQPSGGNYNTNNTGGGGYNKSPYASFPHPGEDESAQQQQSFQSQPFGVSEQPFGVPPSQPIKTEYSVPEY